MHRKTILAVHSHLFTSKCSTFHKCAGHKKSDLFFIPINAARFTRVTFENQAGLHVKCPLILFVSDTLWMQRICQSKYSNKPGLIVVFNIRHESRIYVAPYCVQIYGRSKGRPNRAATRGAKTSFEKYEIWRWNNLAFHTRNNFSENYPQFGHTPSKMFAIPVIRRQRLNNIGLKGCQTISFPASPN